MYSYWFLLEFNTCIDLFLIGFQQILSAQN